MIPIIDSFTKIPIRCNNCGLEFSVSKSTRVIVCPKCNNSYDTDFDFMNGNLDLDKKWDYNNMPFRCINPKRVFDDISKYLDGEQQIMANQIGDIEPFLFIEIKYPISEETYNDKRIQQLIQNWIDSGMQFNLEVFTIVRISEGNKKKGML